MGLPVHLRGRGGPPAGLPCGSQIPTYLSLGVRSLRDLDHHVTACSEGVRACGGGGGCWACFRSGPISVGGGGGSKRSAPLFPGPHEEPAHGLHPRFVVAEIWADRGARGGEGSVPGVLERRGEDVDLCVSAASPICSDFQTFCPDWLHFGHFLCFGGIAASQLSHRIFPIYF